MIGKAWQAADEKGRADAKEKGQVIETLGPAELEKWRGLLQSVTDDWVAKADKKGLNGRKLLDDLQATVKGATG